MRTTLLALLTFIVLLSSCSNEELIAPGKNPNEITEIYISPDSKTMNPGNETTLNAVLVSENPCDTVILWESSDKAIATVSSSGKVKAIKVGDCEIKATVKGSTTLFSTCKITVVETSVSGIRLNRTSLMLLPNQVFSGLTATVTPTDASQSVKWYSSDTKIASVDLKGAVTAHSLGSVTITAETENGKYKATCTVTVADISEFIKGEFIDVQYNGTSPVSGKITCRITNISSDATIKLKQVQVASKDLVIDTKEMVEDLLPGQYKDASITTLIPIYPKFTWTFEYGEKEFTFSYPR